VGIKKDVVFVGQGQRIRLWDVDQFDQYLNSMEDFSTMFEKEFGGNVDL